MKRSTILYILSSILIVTACCHQKLQKEGKCYLHTPDICAKNGAPLSEKISFLPDSFSINSRWFPNQIWPIFQEDYNKLMRCSHEPILYNRYLGKPIFRYTNFAGITIPVTITISKNHDFWYITTTIYNGNPKPDTSFYINWETKEVRAVPNKKVGIRKQLKRRLSWREWSSFSQKLDSLGFPAMQYLTEPDRSTAVCGSESFLEIHTRKAYFFTNHPNQIAEEMIRLSRYHEYWEKFN